MQYYKPAPRKTWHFAKHMLAAGVVIAAVIVSLQYASSNAAAADVSPDASQADESMSLVDKLNAITLDSTFLDDPLFTTLHEYSVPPVKMESGRHNPFAPLDGIKAASAQTPATKAK